MKEVYIGIPTLTEAQRASELLRRERITCSVARMPTLPGKGSCMYGLHLGESSLNAAMTKLRGQNIHTGRILTRETNGTLREIKL